ncbi:hypothetical protein [Halogeometricum sp. CBA1124]|uniref:hypothetical protein n=1 Tax=Halogeometricum sp. CBA1124 TaxID=2668071 RepID=UPI001E48334A|nr:hypothetical protein [Halogeometricum sp. CBA1124]
MNVWNRRPNGCWASFATSAGGRSETCGSSTNGRSSACTSATTSPRRSRTATWTSSASSTTSATLVTRQTYESLYYADYGYTVRGLSSFEQFRTFLCDQPIGVFASFDLADDGYDYRQLDESVQELALELGPETFAPEADPTVTD